MDFLDEFLIELQDFSQDLIFQLKQLKEMDFDYLEKRDSLLQIDATLRKHELEHGSCTSHPDEDIYKRDAAEKYSNLSQIVQDKILLAIKLREMINSKISKLDKELDEKGIELLKKDSIDGSIADFEESEKIDNVSASIIKVQDQVQKSSVSRKKRRNSVSIKQNIPQNQVEDDTVYCFCRLGSFGDMDCPIEWFHYSCVGLTEPPRGSWYCPSCSLRLGLKLTVSR